ncbi:Putative DASH complex subunit Ask1 protein [Septoria linicola]|uniref:DASH complex subunit ASK1 n=1 Tax=Septoria linicola TaxID=215465 RepID=A0A9Q9AW15_9PEZI|nr:putative DASH complex subunit Ask1 protein [Septoria linicola]USW53143.1 Putative DASH complex subunit Ask1 protein [Septoria linicola]
MSRPIIAQQRGLTLPEELEKLEQQITLTLQEIDSNFSKAHRIVTSSILPIVEDYAKHSNEVWEASKFWKHFFEASANVSLSGYEENNNEDTTQTDATQSFQTPTDHEDSTLTGATVQEDDEEFSVESPTQMTGVQTTPKLPASAPRSNGKARAQTHRPASSYRSPSPRKYTGRNPIGGNTPGSEQPSTPRMSVAAGLGSSPFQPDSAFGPPSAFRSQQPQQNHDPLMHRVLDKNYRIQATPMTQRRQRQEATTSKPTPATATKKSPWEDSPQSSPEVSAPQLRSELFSPAKPAPRTPGVSVMTPATRKTGPPPPTTSTGKQLFSAQDKAYTATRDRTRASHMFDDSDEDEDDLGFSPPKTMQFHVPQSRLVQTPAREASRKIVDDLLLTAGADATDDIEDDEYEFEIPSPSVVKQGWEIDDDTF